MEVSPQDIREAEFREKMRGYHQDDVDALLVRVVTTIEVLQNRVRDTEIRAVEAETRLSEVADTEESLRRTLILAQRTADLALREAREEADSILADAKSEHERLTDDNEALRRTLIEQSQLEIRQELTQLEWRRDALQADVAALEGFVTDERARLGGFFAGALRQIEDGALSVVAPPDLIAPPSSDATLAESDADNQEADVPTTVAAPDVGPGLAQQPPTEEISAVALGLVEADPTDGHSLAHGPDEGSEPSMAEPVDLRETAEVTGDQAEEAFLAELRLAVTDDEPLGPRADDFPEPDHEEIDLFARERDANGRFGSRLRRRR
ncbi:MAG: DivIVA domain-containing protein [Acidimicrobiales bacterium]